MIRNKINDKKYIGQTTREIEVRFNEHKGSLLENKHNRYLQNSWSKHGQENFEFKMIMKVETRDLSKLYDKLNELEAEYILCYNSMHNKHGFNLREGGNNSPLSEETRMKISKSLTGKKHSKETIIKMKLYQSLNNAWRGKKHSIESKQKMSDVQRGEKNHFYGKTHTEETKLLIRELATGKFPTEETKKKMSESQTGNKNHFYNKNHTEESKKKISDKLKVSLKGEGNPFYGKHHTEETKQKVRETKRKNYLEKFRKEKGNLVIEVYNQIQNNKGNIEIIRELNITKGFLHNVKNKLNYHGEIIKEYLKGDYKI